MNKQTNKMKCVYPIRSFNLVDKRDSFSLDFAGIYINFYLSVFLDG